VGRELDEEGRRVRVSEEPVGGSDSASPTIVTAEVLDRRRSTTEEFDAVVIGSGFGGAMVARVLVRAGQRVLMLERGDWVARGEQNRAWELDWMDRPGYERSTCFRVEGERSGTLGAFHCVGGPSVFYGGVGLRFRERDFDGVAEISGGARWCIGYTELEGFYDEAERVLGISGDDGADPTSPRRRQPLPLPSTPLSSTSEALADAARRIGYSPFRLPLALNGPNGSSARPTCTACGACDGFACAIGAKNDLATVVLPELVREGMLLRTNVAVNRLEVRAGRIAYVHAVDRATSERLRFRGRRVVLAAGALATPHILLASGLDAANPAGDVVGRNLMRHCNGVVLGAAPAPIGDVEDFRKQIGIHDLYFGDAGGAVAYRKLGAIQQLRATRIALSMARLPGGLRKALNPIASRLVGLLVMAEDQPNLDNRVRLDSRRHDEHGGPAALVRHVHSARDQGARRILTQHARGVLRELGSAFTVALPVRTFSHALGTVRMGDDPELYPVAPDGRFRGTDNLWITDASVFPTAAAVNPSLTIAANALRVGYGLLSPPETPSPRASRSRDRRGATRARVGRARVPVGRDRLAIPEPQRKL